MFNVHILIKNDDFAKEKVFPFEISQGNKFVI